MLGFFSVYFSLTDAIPQGMGEIFVFVGRAASPTPTRYDNHPAKTEAPAKNHHVIARSGATWQSVLIPVPPGPGDALHRRDADCHVGLCPPRNDAVILSWSCYCPWWSSERMVDSRISPGIFRKKHTIPVENSTGIAQNLTAPAGHPPMRSCRQSSRPSS